MKKRIVSLVTALTIMLALIPSALSSLAAPNNITTTVLRLSENPSAYTRIETAPGQLIFTDLPASPDFDYLWFYLLDHKGVRRNETDTARGAGNRTAFSIEGVADGTYALNLLTNSESSGWFTYYLSDSDVTLIITAGKPSFVLSPFWADNYAVYANKRTDSLALEEYKMPSDRIQSDNSNILAMAKTITYGISGDYDKVKAIHDWVAANIWYDYDVANEITDQGYTYSDQSALATLNSRRAVCAGYARLTAALLRAVGIPAKYVTGYGYSDGSGESHAWNEAFADGRWIILDVTWDSGNNYENGQKTDSDGLLGHRYFDTTLDLFSADHTYNDYSEHNLPSDKPDVWALPDVNEAISLGIIPPGLRYGYQQDITRAQFCALAVLLYEKITGAEITDRAYFSDTSDLNVQKMAALGVVKGIGGTLFDPYATLTREQAATILARLAAAAGKPLSPFDSTFSDFPLVGSYAKEAVGQVEAAGIMNGIGGNLFDPGGGYARQQCAVTLLRMYRYFTR